MPEPADRYNTLRRRILPAVHSTLDLLIGGYALSDTPSEEYVATLHCREPEVESLLADLGFSRNVFASLKVRTDGNVSDGSWVHRQSLLAEYQLHAILHETEDGTELYAHWEYSSIRHPYGHYAAQEYSAEKGVTKMRSILQELSDTYDVEWTIEPAFQRHTWYIDLLRAVSIDLAKRIVEIPQEFKDGLTPETPGIVKQTISRVR